MQVDTRKRGRIERESHDTTECPGVGAFGAVFLRDPSFLTHQQLMQTQRGFSNAQSLFGIQRIPTDNQIRNLPDPVAARAVFPALDRSVAYG